MPLKRKKWEVTKGNKDLAAQIAQELSVDPLAALLVTSAGFENIDEMITSAINSHREKRIETKTPFEDVIKY